MSDEHYIVEAGQHLAVTALHESAHAVAFCRLLPWMKTPHAIVTVVPMEGASGAVMFLPWFPRWVRPWMARRYFEASAVGLCAGYAVECLGGYSIFKAHLSAGTDFKLARRRSKRPLIDVQREAIELMRRPENVRAVRVVAAELIERRTLRMDRVRYLIRLSDAR